ncbi:MAG: hypothetical protein WBI07_13400 [Mobilitalea sp.]
MSSLEIKKFKNYISLYLVQNFGMTKDAANDAVRRSAINSLLNEDAEMIMHDSIQYWAKEIWNEYNCMLV